MIGGMYGRVSCVYVEIGCLSGCFFPVLQMSVVQGKFSSFQSAAVAVYGAVGLCASLCADNEGGHCAFGSGDSTCGWLAGDGPVG